MIFQSFYVMKKQMGRLWTEISKLERLPFREKRLLYNLINLILKDLSIQQLKETSL